MAKMSAKEAFEAGREKAAKSLGGLVKAGKEATQSFPAQCGTAVAVGVGLGLVDRTGFGLAIGERTVPASLIVGAATAATMRKSPQGRAVALAALAVGSAKFADDEAKRMGW